MAFGDLGSDAVEVRWLRGSGWKLAGAKRRALAEDGEHVVFGEDHVLDPVELDLVARVLAEQDAIARLHVERTELAVFKHLAVADGDHLALDRLLLGRVRDDDPPFRLLFLLHAFHDKSIGKGTDL